MPEVNGIQVGGIIWARKEVLDSFRGGIVGQDGQLGEGEALIELR